MRLDWWRRQWIGALSTVVELWFQDEVHDD
jgi:hypothetical protein